MNHETYRDTFKKFTRDGIRAHIDCANAREVLPLANYTKVCHMLKLADEQRNTFRDLEGDIWNDLIVYILTILDEQRYYLVPSRMNISLTGMELIEGLTFLDMHMRTGSSIYGGSMLVTDLCTSLMVLVSCLYCAALDKTVELRTLLDLERSNVRIDRERVYEIARDMLISNRHFNHDAKLSDILRFLEPYASNVNDDKAH